MQQGVTWADRRTDQAFLIQWKPLIRETDNRQIRLNGERFWKPIRIK